MRAALALIDAELERHTTEEGWTPEHDDEHTRAELACAATCYAMPAVQRLLWIDEKGNAPALWPWDLSWWKPTPNDRIRELVKAGSLIVSEIERLQRLGSNV